MQNIKITKGETLSLFLACNSGNTVININDGTWTNEVKLRYQTPKGTEVSGLLIEAANTGLLVSLTSDQTNTLDSRSSGYILTFKSSKNDNTVVIKNTIQATVVDAVF